MRARILALLILFCLLALPIGVYWYFFETQSTYIVLDSSNQDEFSLIIEGTFDAEYLPLADSFLRIDQSCRRSCQIQLIPDVRYTLNLMQSGSVSQTHTFELQSGETRRLMVDFITEMVTQKKKIPAYSEKIQTSILAGLQTNNVDRNYRFLRFRDESHAYIQENIPGENRTILGIAGFSGFRPLKTWNQILSPIQLDATKQYFLIPKNSGETQILSIDLSVEYTLPLPITQILSVTDTKIRINDGVYEWNGENLKKNPRFSDFIDLDERYRLGYIASSDQALLDLANYPQKEGISILVDRETGKSSIVKKGVDMAFFGKNGVDLGWYDRDGNFWIIDRDSGVTNIGF